MFKDKADILFGITKSVEMVIILEKTAIYVSEGTQLCLSLKNTSLLVTVCSLGTQLKQLCLWICNMHLWLQNLLLHLILLRYEIL